MLRRTALVFGLLIALPVIAAAQVTNVEAFQQLARECIAEVPDTLQTFRLDAPDEMPYVRTSLVNHWQQQGRSLFVADTTAQPPRPLATLHYRIEDAGVSYARDGGDLQRRVALDLRYTLTGPEGQLVREHSCSETYTDRVPRSLHASLEAEAFPETRGALPEAGGWRRYVEPAVLVTAIGVGVYLFFNLRSGSDAEVTP